jgi:hypothetical protein
MESEIKAEPEWYDVGAIALYTGEWWFLISGDVHALSSRANRASSTRVCDQSFPSPGWIAWHGWWAPSAQSFLVLRCEGLAFHTFAVSGNTPPLDEGYLRGLSARGFIFSRSLGYFLGKTLNNYDYSVWCVFHSTSDVFGWKCYKRQIQNFWVNYSMMLH